MDRRYDVPLCNSPGANAMKIGAFTLICIAVAFGAFAFAEVSSASKAPEPVRNTSAIDVNQDWMVQGQKRYATNCGRCHQAPHKFSPREMATAVRHMRVRAMLTQDDMKYVMYYMTH